MKWLFRGDIHGNFTWMYTQLLNEVPEETAVIIAGDAGFNFFLSKTDERKKKEVDRKGFYIYWLRGNHEARPQNIKGYELIYDENVGGLVYCDPRFPHLRAFTDYNIYTINGYTCVVIGGAYSVDKHWRLLRAQMTEETNNPKESGWFSDEQLTADEMVDCAKMLEEFNTEGKKADFVFTHTCPLSFQPTDLFLNFIDQSTVDNTMEKWMEDIKDKFKWDIWLFGHYHNDRIELPHVEQFYNDIEELDEIKKRWDTYDKTGELPWYLTKGPKFNL